MVLQNALTKVHDHVLEGTDISTPMKMTNAFPPMVNYMVGVGEQELDKLTIRPFDRARFDSWRGDKLKPTARGATLPPDVLDPKTRSQYELVYRGMQVSKTADADGTDEPVVFTSVFWPGPADDPYKQVARTLPDSGTLGVVAGASSAASAGPVWSSSSWPGGWSRTSRWRRWRWSRVSRTG